VNVRHSTVARPASGCGACPFFHFFHLPGVSLTARTEVGNRLARQNIPAKLRTIVELAGLFLTLYLSDTLSLEAIPDDVHFPERRASHGVEIHPEVLTRLLPALLVGFAQIVSAPAKCR
jgi:hypothetical protein